jgi:hypothetical protein
MGLSSWLRSRREGSGVVRHCLFSCNGSFSVFYVGSLGLFFWLMNGLYDQTRAQNFRASCSLGGASGCCRLQHLRAGAPLKDRLAPSICPVAHALPQWPRAPIKACDCASTSLVDEPIRISIFLDLDHCLSAHLQPRVGHLKPESHNHCAVAVSISNSSIAARRSEAEDDGGTFAEMNSRSSSISSVGANLTRRPSLASRLPFAVSPEQEEGNGHGAPGEHQIEDEIAEIKRYEVCASSWPEMHDGFSCPRC